MSKKIKVALIGAGGRGEGVYRVAMKFLPDLEFVGVCDKYPSHCKYVADEMERDGRVRPELFDDYKKCIDKTKPDAIVIAASWDIHVEASIYAMEKGIAVLTEVGGAYDLEGLWKLVDCYERTKTPFMMAENCCYGRLELLALNMKRLGLLGKIVHCDGGYRHDCRTMVDRYINEGHFRVIDYVKRNSENYPTHEVGPIAKLLDINCGNRFVSLVSVASGAYSLKEYTKDKNSLDDYPVTTQWLTKDEDFRKKHLEEVKNFDYLQGDIFTTILKCQNGETVTITLDTTLPRPYSRGFTVHGTKGLITEDNNSVYLDGMKHDEFKKFYNNVDEFYEKYDHPIWKNYKPEEHVGHGGIDYLVFKAFFDALRNGEPMPVDVYDTATMMCITALSEQSLATGGSVSFPDFTKGKWMTRKNNYLL